MKGPKSSHISVLNFVTSGGVFSVLKAVEMCDRYRVTNFLPGELISVQHQNIPIYTEKSHLRPRGARASPAVLPSLCPAWHTPACHRAHSPPLPATICHHMRPYATLAAILCLFSLWIVAGWYFAALAQHRQHALLSNINSEAGAHFLPLCVRE